MRNGYSGHNSDNRVVGKYMEDSVLTMSPGELLIALYDHCLRDLAFAKECMISKDYAKKSEFVTKAKKILVYFTETLDMQYPISQELATLYDFYLHELSIASLHNDTEKIDGLISMIGDIRDGFKGANAILGNQNGLATKTTEPGVIKLIG